MISRISAVLALLTGPALAESQESVLTQEQTVVLACVERLDAAEQATQWPQCVNLIFAPCAQETVGSAPHLTCLTEERVSWNSAVEGLQAQVMEAVTPEGASTLTDLLDQWTDYVALKCNAVAREKAGISADAAQIGCEVAEMVGLSGEYAACLEGRSTAPFCVYPK